MTTKRFSLTAALLLGLSGTGGVARAADQAQTEFLQNLHAINRTEIDVGKLAQSHGQSQATKDYGKVLVDDHKMLDQRVEKLAKAENVDLSPKNPTPAVKDLEQKLGALTNDLKNAPKDKFDDTFATKMAEGHKEAMALVQKAEQTFQGNQAFEALAKGTMPVLQKHEDMAVEILRENKAMAH